MSQARADRPIRVLFVMEQHVGHRTFYLNLRHGIESTPAIQPTWAEITYSESGGWYDRLSFIPAHVRGSLRGRTQVRRAFRPGPYDAAYFNTQVPAAIGLPLPRHLPYLLSTDVTPVQYDRMARPYGHSADRTEPSKHIKKQINKQLFNTAARVLPWSTWVYRSLHDDYDVPANRLLLMPPGIDTDVWTPRPDAQRRGAPLRILFIGGDFYRKGGEVLLHAFSQLPDGLAELHLVTRTPLPQQAGVIGHDRMLPNSPELVALTQSCDVFVLPSEAEAYGIAAAEACAAGLPVIVTDVNGMVDIVDDGITGFVVQRGDIHSIAGHLRSLAEDEPRRIRMGVAARKRAVARFSLRLVTQQLVALFASVVQSP